MADNQNRIDRDSAKAETEFFTVGPPLHAVRAGYVCRKADEVLYDSIIAGHDAHVLAPARSGKTSLIAAMVGVANRPPTGLGVESAPNCSKTNCNL